VLEKFRLENKTTDESFQLTDREKEVLECLVKGMSYKMIAAACFQH
jgi:DNA-binding NarL/FixJ family response regulator